MFTKYSLKKFITRNYKFINMLKKNKSQFRTLMYHSIYNEKITDKDSIWSLKLSLFKSQMSYLKKNKKIYHCNDLLYEIEFLFQTFRYTPNKVLNMTGSLLSPVISRYETIVGNLSNYRANLLLCTIYEGDLVNSDELNSVSDSSKTMVSLFNDAIYKTGKKFDIEVLELRHIFVTPEDYANPIEPSHIGGSKLAAEINDWLLKSA